MSHPKRQSFQQQSVLHSCRAGINNRFVDAIDHVNRTKGRVGLGFLATMLLATMLLIFGWHNIAFTVPLYFPGQITVPTGLTTPAVVAVDLDGEGLTEVVAGREDGAILVIKSVGSGIFAAVPVLDLGGSVVDLAVFNPGPGPEEILVALTANPDRVHILAVVGGDLPFESQGIVDLNEDPRGLTSGPIGPGGTFGLAVTLPGIDRWVVISDTVSGWEVIQEIHSGDRPVAIALMDLNGDQILEAVTADEGPLSRAFSIYERNGNEQFNLVRQVPAPATLASLLAYPTNNPEELYVCYSDSAFINVYVPQTGSLVEVERIDSFSPVDGVIVTELGREYKGLLGWRSDRGIVHFFEKPIDVWQPIESYYCGGPAKDIVMSDINHDFFPDLVVANGEASTLALLFANDSPSFRAYLATAVPPSPNDGLAMDEDLDGHLDMLVASIGSSTIEFLRGDGLGHFVLDPQSLPLDNAARSLTACFANGDTLVDLAIVLSTGDKVSIMLRQPGGGYVESSSILTGQGPFRILASDFDGDGFEDLAIGNEISDDITLAFGDGSGMFSDLSTIPLTNNLSEIHAVDLTSDNLDDLLLILTQGSIATMLNLGNRIFGQARFYTVGLSPVSLGTADLDGDEDEDVIVAKEGDDGLAIFENLGNGSLYRRIVNHDLEGSPGVILTHDIDLNGTADVVLTYPTESSVGIVLNVGNWLLSPPLKLISALQPFALAVGDFNEDQIPDIVSLDRALHLALSMLNIEPNPIAVQPTGLSAFCRGDKVELLWLADPREPWRLFGETVAGWTVLADPAIVHFGSLDWHHDQLRLVLTAAQMDAANLSAGSDGQIAFRLEYGASSQQLQATVNASCLTLTTEMPPPLLTLAAPHPNPFNPGIAFRFSLARPARVMVAVWDLAGRRVAVLADHWFTAGDHDMQWDGRANCQAVSAGTYLLTVATEGQAVHRKITLVK